MFYNNNLSKRGETFIILKIYWITYFINSIYIVNLRYLLISKENFRPSNLNSLSLSLYFTGIFSLSFVFFPNPVCVLEAILPW